VLGELVVSKDQRARRIKQSDIKSRFIQLPVEKIIGKLAISEMVLFNEPSNKWRATRGVADVFR